MITALRDILLRLPTSRSVVQSVTRELIDGRCHLVVRPAARAADSLSDAIVSEIQRQDLSLQSVDSRTLNPARLTWALRDLFAIPGDSEHTASLDQILHFLAKLHVVSIDGIGDLSMEDQVRWLQFIAAWAKTCRHRADRGLRSPAIFADLTLHDAVLSRVETDLGLSVTWWWGMPTAPELHLACRQLASSDDERFTSLWREQLAVSLASGDLELAVVVWNAATCDLSDLRAAIRAYASERQWNEMMIRGELDGSHGFAVIPQWNQAQTLCGGGTPPRRLLSLWNRGAIHLSREHGHEIHSAALSVLEDAAPFESRLWRCQIPFVLPWLDSVRQHLCRNLTMRHGPSWPLRWLVPESVEEQTELSASANACQWGHLCRLLADVVQLRAERGRFLTVASRGKKLRNSLAHGRPVEFRDVASFVRAAEESYPYFRS